MLLIFTFPEKCKAEIRTAVVTKFGGMTEVFSNGVWADVDAEGAILAEIMILGIVDTGDCSTVETWYATTVRPILRSAGERYGWYRLARAWNGGGVVSTAESFGERLADTPSAPNRKIGERTDTLA